ncbi:MAG: ABC-type phosphate/phosphonate transport system permease subunit [Planctomycetota bacterium]|jgi:ABC-type phosphate/phosphonate transport system permease subunit
MNPDTNINEKPKKKRKWKWYLLLIILAGIVYGYFWYQGVHKRDISAQEALQMQETYSALINALDSEYSRCKGFIAQETGNFGSFEYCKGFLDWAERVK